MNTSAWGPSAWAFLHEICLHATPDSRDKIHLCFLLLRKCLPCSRCRESFHVFYANDPLSPKITAASAHDYACKLHTLVNAKLFKPSIGATVVASDQSPRKRSRYPSGSGPHSVGTVWQVYSLESTIIDLCDLLLFIAYAYDVGFYQDDSSNTISGQVPIDHIIACFFNVCCDLSSQLLSHSIQIRFSPTHTFHSIYSQTCGEWKRLFGYDYFLPELLLRERYKQFARAPVAKHFANH